jgi:hypothetical protein
MEELQQHIEDYLNDRLDATTKADFEARMAVDTDLREEVVKLQLLRQIAKRNATREKIKAIQTEKISEWKAEATDNEEITDETERAKPKLKIWRNFGTFAAAASVALVMYLNFSSISMPNEATLSERGNGAELDSIQKVNFENYLTAQKALQSGDNATAISYFEKVANATEIRPYYKDASTWFLAVANVEKSPKKAEELMQNILSKQDFKYEVSLLDKARMWTKIQVSKVKNWF